MRRARIAVVVAWLGCAPPAHAFPAADLPLQHWAYDVLSRLELRAPPERTFLDLRPLTRGEAAELAERFGAAAASGAWQPTAQEHGQLEMLQGEFARELAERHGATGRPPRADHLWSGSGWRLWAAWNGRQRFERPTTTGASVPTD